jgi:hypothetical protein
MTHVQTSHLGIPGKRRQTYQDRSARLAKVSTFRKTVGASGKGAAKNGAPTRSPCSAPGICVSVYTTSGPIHGHVRVVKDFSPMR